MFKDFIVSKEEREKLKNKKSNSNKNVKIIVVVFIILLVFSLFTRNNSSINLPSYNIEEEKNILDVISQIDTNYSMKITQTVNDKEYKFDYNTDGKITTNEYVVDNVMYSYIYYSDSEYRINDDNMSLIKTNNENKINDYFYKPYYDIALLKNLMVKNETTATTDLNYNIKVSDFLKEMNYKYDTNYKTILDENINIKITNNGYTIVIDYTNVDKVINNKNDSVIYKIVLSNINKNNYSNVSEYIKNK